MTQKIRRGKEWTGGVWDAAQDRFENIQLRKEMLGYCQEDGDVKGAEQHTRAIAELQRELDSYVKAGLWTYPE